MTAQNVFFTNSAQSDVFTLAHDANKFVPSISTAPLHPPPPLSRSVIITGQQAGAVDTHGDMDHESEKLVDNELLEDLNLYCCIERNVIDPSCIIVQQCNIRFFSYTQLLVNNTQHGTN